MEEHEAEKAKRDKTDDKENESELDIISEHFQEKFRHYKKFGKFKKVT
jgi:hypothetical protein